jgi:hypothetical protein
MLLHLVPDPTQIVVSCAEAKHTWLATVFNLLTAPASALFGLYLGARLTEKSAGRAEQRRREADTRNLAASLAAEIAGLMQNYEQIGTLINNATEVHELQFGFSAPLFDYFVIFDSNASRIGLLDPKDAQDLVSFYLSFKSHFEDLVNWVAPRRHQASLGAQQSMFKTIKETDAKLIAMRLTLSARLMTYGGL